MLLNHQLKNIKNFSSSEEKLAEYILIHSKRVPTMTIQELATETYTSPATITRFCRKLNTLGFSDFKVQLARELSSFTMTDTRIPDERPFQKDESPHAITKNILNLNFQAMNDTYQAIDPSQLLRIATLINNTPHIYVYGTGQSLILALDFQYKLFRIERDCNVEANMGFQPLKALTQPEDSVAIVLSYYGRSKNNLEIIRVLHERNIPVILITGPNTNNLCEYAQEVVHVPTDEHLSTKMASFASRTAMQIVLDMIFALLFSLAYEQNEEIIRIHPWESK